MTSQILLQMALALLMALQSHPEASPELRAQVIETANHAIVVAMESGIEKNEIDVVPSVEGHPEPVSELDQKILEQFEKGTAPTDMGFGARYNYR